MYKALEPPEWMKTPILFIQQINQTLRSLCEKKAYINYPTIINNVAEKGNSSYHFKLEDFAQIDNQIAAAQQSIGTSTDTAQLNF